MQNYWKRLKNIFNVLFYYRVKYNKLKDRTVLIVKEWRNLSIERKIIIVGYFPF
jgi:hypothetical protein